MHNARCTCIYIRSRYKKPKIKLKTILLRVLIVFYGRIDGAPNPTTYKTLSASQRMLFSKAKIPPFLIDLDFYNAKFVDVQKPLKPIMNDQRFTSLTKSKRYRRGSAVVEDSDKWPNGRIPYILSAAYTLNQRAVLARAISSYNLKTCIRFVPKLPTDRDYVVISKLDGCYADFARVGGRQQVSLSDECIDYATIIHEFMHVIGFIHEHQREDRDAYVKILWENIIEGANNDFDKLSAVGLSNYGVAYDYFSIMHYESTEGSRNGKNTIEAKHNEYTSLMGKSTDFTTGDLNRVNRAYNCSAHLKYYREQ